MPKHGRCLALLFILSAISPFTSAQGSLSCKVDHALATEADNALARQEFDHAEQMYLAQLQQHPGDPSVLVGIVRSELGQNRIAAALALARKNQAEHPHNALFEEAMGEVDLRRGQLEEAARAFNEALHIDPCLGRIHFDISRYYNLEDMHATARKQLELAHALAPDNPVINRAWRQATTTPPTAQQSIADLKQRLLNPSLTPEQKSAITESIRAIEAQERGDCQPVHDTEAATLRLEAITNGLSLPLYAIGLDVYLNGKRRRLQIDTGASGLIISRSSAISAGLIPEAEIKAHGIGDRGPVASFITHVDNIRIGGMEFRNCQVRVLERRSVLDVDGLIGTDVFRNYLVTLDTPSRELRLAPLPKRPDVAAKLEGLATTGEGNDVQPGANAPPIPRDRFIPPEMKDWTRIYRVGHNLILPTSLVLPTGVSSGPPKLFIMDSGAALPVISIEAAREVTSVGNNDGMHLRGLSGEVKDVKEAESITIQFAGIRQRMPGTTSIDTSAISRELGVEIAGFIAFPTLRDLVVTIDYRDNLLHVVYDPAHGMHSH